MSVDFKNTKIFELVFKKSKVFWFIILVLFLGLIFYFYLIYFYLDNERLYGDEVFYWFQAKEIREGFKFINFENTQPLLFPLTLILFKDLSLARLFNAFLTLLGSILFIFYLYPLLKIKPKEIKLSVILIALILFLFSPFTISTAISLYTEALFMVFLILLFILYSEFASKPNFKNLFLFGLILGLTIQTRITGIIVFLFVFFYLLLEKKFKFKHLFSFLLAFVIFLPYLFLSGFQFLAAKTTPIFSLEVYTLMLINRIFQAFYFYLPFLILFFLGVYSIFRKKDEAGRFHLYFIIFILITSVLTPFAFLRYWQIFLPSIIFFICLGLIYLFKKIKIYSVVLAIFLLFFSVYGYMLWHHKDLVLPNLYYGNHYFLEIPNYCIEIKQVLAAPITKEGLDESRISLVNLPIFNQPENSIFEYGAFIDLPDNEYKFAIFNYLDEEYRLFLNRSEVSRGHEIWTASIFKLDNPTKHLSIEIDVLNRTNIGGIGQILICKQNPYKL